MNVLRKIPLIAFVTVFAAGLNVNGGDVVVNDLNKLSGWILDPSKSAQIKIDDSGVIETKGQLIIYSRDFITIDPAKKYRLSGQFRCAPGTKSNRFYFGFQPFDASRKTILPAMVGVVSGTDSELAAPCNPADKTLKVVDASMWQTGGKYCVAFNIDPAGTDLPNRTLSVTGVKALKAAGSAYEVVLDKPCGVSAAAGTKIRLHQTGNTYIYPAAEYKETPAEWQECSGIIKPEIASGSPRDAWWKGTKLCRIVILANYAQGAADAALQIKNIKLEELEEATPNEKNK